MTPAAPNSCIQATGCFWLEGGLTMDKRISLDMPIGGTNTAARPRFKLKNIFGRDWKIAYLFVLPMIVLMAGLIFWPFISAIIDVDHDVQLPDRRDDSMWASATSSACSPIPTTCCRCRIRSTSPSGRCRSSSSPA